MIELGSFFLRKAGNVVFLEDSNRIVSIDTRYINIHNPQVDATAVASFIAAACNNYSGSGGGTPFVIPGYIADDPMIVVAETDDGNKTTWELRASRAIDRLVNALKENLPTWSKISITITRNDN